MEQYLRYEFVGEHIIEVMIWADSSWIYAIQFVTNYHRVSPHYGGHYGTPTILRSEDGVLVAFSGKSITHPGWKTDLIRQIQVCSVFSLLSTYITKQLCY